MRIASRTWRLSTRCCCTCRTPASVTHFAQVFGRKCINDASYPVRGRMILRTMGPVEFVFDISDTEPINPQDDRVPAIVANPFPAKGNPPATCIAPSGEGVRESRDRHHHSGSRDKPRRRRPPHTRTLDGILPPPEFETHRGAAIRHTGSRACPCLLRTPRSGSRGVSTGPGST